jgi:hypothetical protein
MAFSYYTYTGDGTTTQFPVAFGYIRREHVLATVAGAPATFTFVNSTTIQMDAPPANGAVVRVYRQTPLTAPLVNFTDGSTLVAADLDTNALQSIYTQQELDDSLVDGLAGVIPNGDKGDITTSVNGSVWTIDNGAVTTAKLASVIAPTVSSLNGGPLAGFRNRIINGDFDFWQRGTSFTGNEYGADRWIHNRVGTTHAATREPFALGQTDVPGEPTYFCRSAVASVAGATNFSALVQFIEDVRTFAGQQVTVSFWAKADSTKNIAIELQQNFGTGGSPSTTVEAIGTTKVSIGTSWQKVTVTATLPSISGKTLGTTVNNSLVLAIFFDAGSDFNARTDSLGQQSGTFDIAQVQIEPGPVATPFEQRPIGTELALCQRYYYQPGSAYTVQSYGGGAGAITTTQIYFPAQMRANPIITAAWSAGVNAVGSTIYALGAIGATAILASTTSADFAAIITWTSFSAEL